MYSADNLCMIVPVGAIYGFIGENVSDKSTTEKLIGGHLVPDGGEIKLFGKNYTDAGVRVRVGSLIERHFWRAKKPQLTMALSVRAR